MYHTSSSKWTGSSSRKGVTCFRVCDRGKKSSTERLRLGHRLEGRIPFTVHNDLRGSEDEVVVVFLVGDNSVLVCCPIRGI